jgi:Tol biopolymer transport system component
VKAAPRAGRTARLRRSSIIFAAAVLALIAVVLSWSRLTSPPAPFQHVELRPLTNHGSIDEAAISPDGRCVAYISRRGDGQAIWLRQLRTGSQVHVSFIPDGGARGLQFSPEGDFLYYTKARRPSGAALYRVPSFGGAPEMILDDVARKVAISPDGNRFAYLPSGPEGRNSIIIAGPNPNEKKTIIVPNSPEFLRPTLAWSPDGQRIALAAGSSEGLSISTERLMVVPVDGSRPKIVAPVKWGEVQSAAWLADGGALLVNAAPEGGRLQLWLVPYPTGKTWRLTNDGNEYSGVSVTADSTAAVTVQRSDRGEMWVTAPGGGTPSQLTQTLAFGEGSFGIAWAPSGRLVYSTGELGTPDLWIANADNTNRERLTFGSVAIRPEVSLDGRTIFFNAEKGGMRHIWRIDIDGGNAAQVTRGGGEQSATVSPDGKWLMYQTISVGPTQVWKMALPSGTPLRVGDLRDSRAPNISPDGQWVCVTYSDGRFQPSAGIGIMRLDGTGFRPLNDVAVVAKRWSPDGKSIYFVKTEQGVGNIWKQAIDGGKPVRITNFTSGLIRALAVSANERLAFNHYVPVSDAVLIRNAP